MANKKTLDDLILEVLSEFQSKLSVGTRQTSLTDIGTDRKAKITKNQTTAKSWERSFGSTH